MELEIILKMAAFVLLLIAVPLVALGLGLGAMTWGFCLFVEFC